MLCSVYLVVNAIISRCNRFKLFIIAPFSVLYSVYRMLSLMLALMATELFPPTSGVLYGVQGLATHRPSDIAFPPRTL